MAVYRRMGRWYIDFYYPPGRGGTRFREVTDALSQSEAIEALLARQRGLETADYREICLAQRVSKQMYGSRVRKRLESGGKTTLGTIRSLRKFSGMDLVYMFQVNAPGGPVKIGRTNNVHKRLQNLVAMWPYRFPVVTRCLLVEGRPYFERDLHVAFANSRLHGEWFMPTAELERFIASRRRIEGGKLVPYEALDTARPTGVNGSEADSCLPIREASDGCQAPGVQEGPGVDRKEGGRVRGAGGGDSGLGVAEGVSGGQEGESAS